MKAQHAASMSNDSPLLCCFLQQRLAGATFARMASPSYSGPSPKNGSSSLTVHRGGMSPGPAPSPNVRSADSCELVQANGRTRYYTSVFSSLEFPWSLKRIERRLPPPPDPDASSARHLESLSKVSSPLLGRTADPELLRATSKALFGSRRRGVGQGT